MGCRRCTVKFSGFVSFLFIFFSVKFSAALTDPRDVEVISRLYVSLGFPPLQGWHPAGDPCGESWQGVECVFSNITAIDLKGQNLGGNLGETLGFASVISMDLSSNHIGGSIPSDLPPTITKLSLNNNSLSGRIPDSFLQLGILDTLDLSFNNLSGQLPPSFGNLSSLYILHLQNNHLSGALDVLLDLHLVDLDVENNLLSGPIPGKLLTIPNFRKDGNPFNTTVIPSPAPAPEPATYPADGPYSDGAPWSYDPGHSAPDAQTAPKSRSFLSRKSIFWIIGLCVLLVVIMAFGLLLYYSRCFHGQQVKELDGSLDLNAFKGQKGEPTWSESLLHFETQDKAKKEAIINPFSIHGVDKKKVSFAPTQLRKEKMDEMTRTASFTHKIELTGMDNNITSREPSLATPSQIRAEQFSVDPMAPAKTFNGFPSKNLKPTDFVDVFTIASLQQYTNSFSQNNFIGKGMLGSVYRAELPDGKLVAVKNLDAVISRQLSDEKFLELVSSISRLRHENIVELVGYCVEHGQRLLVYNYCSNETLFDTLHMNGEMHEKLSWNVRVTLALEAARALEYLHEVCQPPVVHANFKSANILLDGGVVSHVSDCGLAPLFSSDLAQQVTGTTAYDAPETQSGTVTCQSDVYSFGVVMLELLTARKTYDRSRPRGQQSIVRWAIPQLHDIDALSKMVDPSLKGEYPMKSLSRFADVISLCLQWQPEFRPPISEIVQELLQLVKQKP